MTGWRFIAGCFDNKALMWEYFRPVAPLQHVWEQVLEPQAMQGLNITAFQYNKVHMSFWTQAGHAHHCKQCRGHWTRGVVRTRSQSQAAQRNIYRARKLWITKAWSWIFCPFPSYFFLLVYQHYAKYLSGREVSSHPLFSHNFVKQPFWQSASLLSVIQWEPIGTLEKLENTTGTAGIIVITVISRL